MRIAFLYKDFLSENACNSIYLNKLGKLFPDAEVTFIELPYEGKKKVSATVIRDFNMNNAEIYTDFDYVLIGDADWFKVTTRTSKAETNLGIKCKSDFSDVPVFYIPNHKGYFIDKSKVNNGVDIVYSKMNDLENGVYIEIGNDIINSANYPKTVDSIKTSLNQLYQYPELFIDIEARSLQVTTAGIYTIAFAWDKHNGIAFPVDAIPEQAEEIKKLLKDFFINYHKQGGKLTAHKANYDIPIINFELFMNRDITDIASMLSGLSILHDNLDDTLLISYLATNSCSGNNLSLKHLAQPFAGNWAVDVKDVTKVDLDVLLQYNLIDTLSTAYVKETYYPMMVKDSQEKLYKEFFLPVLKDNLRCQLIGLPIDLEEVNNLKESLNFEINNILITLRGLKEVQEAEYIIAEKVTEKRNNKLKTKQVTIDDNIKEINFNSDHQVRTLLFDVMNLPVIETTESGLPSIRKKALNTMKDFAIKEDHKTILQLICDLTDANKILTGFIPAFEKAHVDKHNNAHLLGYLNLGGTVSGRLSSNNPNLQNLPSKGSRFAKPVKKCFKSTDEWIFVGCDFKSLEDRISALTTRDPNKLLVYTDGYDGHCLRAYTYFKDEMPDINPTSVESINSIEDKYPDFRQDSKAPTFLLTYGGTKFGLVHNCGFSMDEATKIEKSYHELYKVSDEWVQERIKKACEVGYVTTGFGLRVRTPLLAQTVYSKKLKGMSSAEARTAGNALGQGWGCLNDRAMNEVLRKVDKLNLSDSILPVCKIHDACYFLVKNNPTIIKILNDLCVDAFNWNDHPEIYNEDVGLGGDLDIFYPTWKDAFTLEGKLSEEEIEQLAQDHLDKLSIKS